MKKQQKKHLKQVQTQSQQGRSMVEMLGVLAIIGVLSIGGIAGYRWGMDKHVTNQILYEMNLNSPQLAMLLQKGNADGVTLSLGSPYDDGKFRTVDYGFDYACGEKASLGRKCQYIDETMYSMTATGLPKRICNMLNDSVFGMAYYYNHTINGDENNECNDTDNIVTVFFDTDTTIDGEIPRPGEPETRTPVPEVTGPTTTTTTTETTSIDKTCPSKTNEECMQKLGPDYFCLSRGCDGCSGNTITENCSTYTCESIESSKSEEINDVTYYYYKSTDMNWWSADRYCQALQAKGLRTNGTLVSLGDLGCIAVEGTGGCASGGALQKTLKAKGWTDWVWTRTPYGNGGENSCLAYAVSLDRGSVAVDNRLITRYAVCAPETE